MKRKLNLHAVIPVSTVNGPGQRMVIFFQGCARGCQNCFNPATHPFTEALAAPVEELCREAQELGVEGLTISGGEPFSQPEALLELLKRARENYRLSTVVYTGYRLEELRGRERLREALGYVDVLVDGPYDDTRPERTTLARGSTNQRFQFLTARYGIDDFYMPARLEVKIAGDGVVTATGFGALPGATGGI